MFPTPQKFTMPTAQPFSMPQAQPLPSQVTPSVPVGAMSRNPQPLIPTANAATISGSTAPVVTNKPVTPLSQMTVAEAQASGQGDAYNNLVNSYSTKYTPTNYNVTTPTQVDSSTFGTKNSMGTLNDVYNKKGQDLINGTNPNLSPSDSLMQEIYKNKQYSPEETAALQKYSDATAQINAKTLAMKHQVKALVEDGSMTKEGAAAAVSEAERRANAELADLGVQQNSAALNLDVFGKIRANQLGAYQTLFDMTKGSTTLSPGQGLYSATGQQVAGAMGVAPQTLSQAQVLLKNDSDTGKIHYTPDGNIDQQYYNNQANMQLFGQPLANYQPTQGGSVGSSVVGSQNQLPKAGTPEGNAYYASPQFAQQLPQTVYPAKQTTSTGMTYFDSSQLKTPDAITQAYNISQQTGIPVVDGADAAAINTTDQAIKNLRLLESNFKSLASNNVAGAVWSNITDPISGVLQTSRGSAINTYNSNRNGLLQQIRALAGSSPRINGTELQLANDALPTLSEFSKDTLPTGQKKIDTTIGYLNNALSSLIKYQGVSGQASGATLGQNQSTGGSSNNPFSSSNFYGK